jgi:hypothetical protein
VTSSSYPEQRQALRNGKCRDAPAISRRRGKMIYHFPWVMVDRDWIVGIVASVRPFLLCGPDRASATARRQEEGTSVILCRLDTRDKL